MAKLKDQTYGAARCHAMLHDSPTYQAFIDYHGRWITAEKAGKIVRSLQQVPITAAHQQVTDWLDTDEVVTNRSGLVNMASLFLAMGY